LIEFCIRSILTRNIVISNKNETTLAVALYPPTPFSQKGRKGSKTGMSPCSRLPSPYLGEGTGVRAVFGV